MDVIALAQFGLDYSVAALGTATSKDHLELLFRFSSEIVLCFDGDKAGKEASWRAVTAALPSLRDGRSIKIMQMPVGIDPDDLIREQGLAKFEQRIDAAQALSDYFFQRLTQGLNLNTEEGKSGLINKAKGYLEKLPEGVFRDLMLTRLEQLSKVDNIGAHIQSQKNKRANKYKQKQEDTKLSPMRLIISLLLQNPSLLTILEKRSIDWALINAPGVEVLKKIVEIIVSNPNISLACLMEHFRGQEEEKYIKIMINHDFFISGDEIIAEFSGAIEQLVQQGKENRLDQLIAMERQSGLSPEQKKELLTMLAARK